MSDFKLVKTDDVWDLDDTNQELSLVEDYTDDNGDFQPEAIAQEMRIAMQFHRGEWALNILLGIPYLEQVFIKNPSLAALSVLFTRAARSVPGIVSVQDMALELETETRELDVSYRATAQNGGVIEDTLPLLL